jgi:hypothetical protein
MKKLIAISLLSTISLVASEINSTQKLYDNCKELVSGTKTNPKAIACNNFISGIKALHDSTMFHQRYIKANAIQDGIELKRHQSIKNYVNLTDKRNNEIASAIVKYLDNNKNLLKSEIKYALWGSMQDINLKK